MVHPGCFNDPGPFICWSGRNQSRMIAGYWSASGFRSDSRTSVVLLNAHERSITRLPNLTESSVNASEFTSLETLVDHANSQRRFFVLLVSTFAALGVLLAALGIHGVISYGVTRQTQEIGIRMALGESATQVRTRVLVSTLRLASVTHPGFAMQTTLDE
jgi:hypothetical protein